VDREGFEKFLPLFLQFSYNFSVQALYYLFGLWVLIVRLGIWMCGYLQEGRYSVKLLLIVVVLMVLAQPLY